MKVNTRPERSRILKDLPSVLDEASEIEYEGIERELPSYGCYGGLFCDKNTARE